MFSLNSYIAYFLLLVVATFAVNASDYPVKDMNPSNLELRFEIIQNQAEGYELPAPAAQPDFDYLDQYLLVLNEWDVDSHLQTIIPKSRLFLQPFLGKNLSLGDIYRIANGLTTHLTSEGYALARVLVPAQKISDGRVKLVVILGHIGKIKLNTDVLENYTQSEIRTRLDKFSQQKPLMRNTLSREVLLINDLPGYQLRGQFTPSESEAYAVDFLAETQYQSTSTHIYINNFGDTYTGFYRIGLLHYWNDLLGHSDQITLAFNTSSRFDQLKALNLGYEESIVLTDWRWYSNFYGSQTKPQAELASLEVEGFSYGIALGVKYPQLRSLNANLFWDVGIDFYKTQQDTLFGTNSDAAVRKFKLGWQGDYRDSWGLSMCDLQWSLGMDAWGATTTTQLVPQGAKLDFSKMTFECLRQQPLYFDNFFAKIKLKKQWSSGIVLSSERLSFGAESYARSSTYGAYTGDEGLGYAVDLTWDISFNHQIWTPFMFWERVNLERLNENSNLKNDTYGYGLLWRLGDHWKGQVFFAETTNTSISHNNVLGQLSLSF